MTAATKILVGTPTANGLVASGHVKALLTMTKRLSAHGIVVDYRTVDGPNLAIQRDYLAHESLASDCSHLLLIDGDLEFRPDLAERLLALSVPLAGVAYATSGPDLARAATLSDRHGIDAALALSSSWNLRAIDGALRVEGNRARVAAVGPGCLLVARSCLETLGRTDLPYYGAFNASLRLRPFFRTMPGESVSALDERLCDLWRAQGGEVWIDVHAHVARLVDFRFGMPFTAFLRALGSRSNEGLALPVAAE